MLVGRDSEKRELDRLLAAVRGGRSRSLVLRGEAGVGKSALLEYAIASADETEVASVLAVESEMELTFAGLHQLLLPFLGDLERLPVPQRSALASSFGLIPGTSPDRFLVGLATLTLIADAAVKRPVLCVVDDAQWLDSASIDVLGFVARRLFADPVGMLFAIREGEDESPVLADLPQLRIGGLSQTAAGELLSASVGGPLNKAVVGRVVGETAGNPLALVELGAELTARELSGATAVGEPLPVGRRLEKLFLSRAKALPTETQRLLLVAAADPSGQTELVRAAAERLGIGPDAADHAALDPLMTLAPSVRFRHPLMRSAVYHGASSAERRRVHEALAAAGDRDRDPDRRAWHLAAAAIEPDEAIAVELERSAGRARARGGSAAAAAFMERSLALTGDPSRRVARALAAAQVSLQAGVFDSALGLLSMAEDADPDEVQRARADLLRGQIAFASGFASDAPPLLLRAAERLEPLNLDLARETYLDAWGAAAFAGPVGADDLLRASRGARALPRARSPRPIDVLLDSLALLVAEGRVVAAPLLRRAADIFANEAVSLEEGLRWGWLATAPSLAMWDNDRARAVCARQIEIARDAGALEQLPILLVAMGLATSWSGDLTATSSLIAELDEVTAATGAQIPPTPALLLAGLRGREREASALIDATIKRAGESGQGVGVSVARWVAAVLYNGLGRYEEALAAAREACWDPIDFYPSMWALPELVESAARCGQPELARAALHRLVATTQPQSTDHGLGIEARARALLGSGESAEVLYREAIIRLSRTRERTELARAHLLYGEWLRRERRRIDARSQLRIAHDMFVVIGMEAFAERAGRELLATGERLRKRTVEARDDLTAQEERIALLAREGLSNSEIGARLFISSSTVAYHLRKVFRKLGIGSRSQLAEAMG